MAAFRGSSRYFAGSVRFVVWFLVFTLFLPAPMMSVGTVNAAPARSEGGMAGDAELWNRHVHERWNSPERARAIEQAARIEAEARAQFEQNEAATAQRHSLAPSSRHSREGGNPDSPSLVDSGEKALDPRLRGGDGSESRPQSPQSVTEVLFNHAAGFAGVPGLAPRQGVDGSFDEGLGFHQDGTARRAGGSTGAGGASGPSDNGQRARAYMQSGLQGGYGPNGSAMTGYGSGFGAGYGGLYDEFHHDLWGRNDPTRGGRIGAGNGYSRELGDFDPLSMAIDRA